MISAELSEKIENLKTIIKNNNITYEQLSKDSAIPVSTIKKIFCGFTKNPRLDTVQAIERALGLDKENEKKTIMDRPTSDLAENFIRENMELIKEKAFNDLTKLYKVMTETQKLYIVAYIVGMLTNSGVDTKSIVGY